jgi:hypothetical protein
MDSVFDEPSPSQVISDAAYGVVKGGLESLKDPSTLIGLATGPVGILGALASYSPEAEGVMIPKNFGGGLTKYRAKGGDMYHLPTGPDTWTGVSNPLDRVAAGEKLALPQILGEKHPAFDYAPRLRKTEVVLGKGPEPQYIAPEIEQSILEQLSQQHFRKPYRKLNNTDPEYVDKVAKRYRDIHGIGRIEMTPDALATEGPFVFGHELDHGMQYIDDMRNLGYDTYHPAAAIIEERLSKAFQKKPAFKDALRTAMDPNLTMNPPNFKKRMAWSYHPLEQRSELNAMLDTGVERSDRIPGLRLVEASRKK